MTLVAGVDSSTQSCKVLICDAVTGQVVRSGKAPHPEGTEVNPEFWWRALQDAIEKAGGLDDVAAISIAGQQHGMVLLDSDGNLVRDALLWNDTRSASAAQALIRDLDTSKSSGEKIWAERTGLVPVASFTASKIRWVAENEPENLARSEAVCLPHDWLTWRLAGQTDIRKIKTDRSDASGTAYYSASTDAYDLELVKLSSIGKNLLLPEIVKFDEAAFQTGDLKIGAGMGDNAAAALGVGISSGDILISVGTSAVVTALESQIATDDTGVVAGFASAFPDTFLPLACTLNGAELFDRLAKFLGVSLDELSDLALTAKPGSDGVITIPFFNGERTPNLPSATGEILGLTLHNLTRENIARSFFEGILCGLADAAARISSSSNGKIYLVGGAANSEALRKIAPTVLGRTVIVPQPAEYVALGAAKQAAACLGLDYTSWQVNDEAEYSGEFLPEILDRYRTHLETVIAKTKR